MQRFHTAVSAFGYDVKSGLLVIAGDSGITASSSGGYSQDSTGDPPASPAAAFDHEGLTVSVWQLHEQELRPRFHLGKLQVR